MDVMVDLETLGTAPNSIILTIGAVKFNRKDAKNISTFYRRITIESCAKVGLTASKATEAWWNSQNEDARREAFGKERETLDTVLSDFSSWFNGARYIWSHGASFDCVILEQAYNACKQTIPWKFWNVRDTRTLYDVGKVNLKKFSYGVEHHALHDALRQVQALKMAFEKLTPGELSIEL